MKKIIDEMGCLFEDFGVNPIMGRIFGVLLCSESPKSLIEISKALSLSKASISIQIRILENLGYCRKIPKTKNRQNFYVLRENYLEVVYRKRLDKEKTFLMNLNFLKQNTFNKSSICNKRLSDFYNFNTFILENQMSALSKWSKGDTDGIEIK